MSRHDNDTLDLTEAWHEPLAHLGRADVLGAAYAISRAPKSARRGLTLYLDGLLRRCGASARLAQTLVQGARLGTLHVLPDAALRLEARLTLWRDVEGPSFTGSPEDHLRLTARAVGEA